MESIFSLSPWVMAVVPLIVGLVELIKKTGLTTRYAPLASLLIGVGLTFLVPGIATWQEAVVQGLIAGLISSGLYSGQKTTLKK